MSDSENRKTWDISAAGPRELEEKLSDYYGVESIHHHDDHYREDTGEYVLEALTYWDGETEHFIAADVPIYGHGPSGAAGCWKDDLPNQETVEAVVEAAQSPNAEKEATDR